MATFAGATFRALHQNSQDSEFGAAVSVRHIPGSDTSVVDLGGQQVGSIRLPVWFENIGQYTALRALRGQQGTLNMGDETRPAILVGVRSRDPFPNGTRFGSAEFVLV